MRKYIPPFILFLIGVGFYYYSGDNTSTEETRTDNKPLAKKNPDQKKSKNKAIYGDPFPSKYLANWKTDEGLMVLMQGSDMHVRGFYYGDNNEVRGRVTTTYIQKDNRKILSGYWVQPKSAQKCDYQRYGSYYWGRLAFDFQDNRFIGIWGYCDDKTKDNWNGKLSYS